jgi:outer membrane phospholipase A
LTFRGLIRAGLGRWPAVASLLLLVLAAYGPSPLLAAEEAATAPETATPAKPEESGPIHLLSGNEPSYFAFAHDSGSSENHIEFYLSIKYPLLTTLVERYLGQDSRLYFDYNGKYDFYAFSRNSSPIISRLQNPGVMYERTWPAVPHLHLQSLKTGYFHESNGQTVDTRAEYLATEHASDYVSRGWDYIPLVLKFAVTEKRHGIFGNFYLYLQGRYFLDRQLFRDKREDQVFWETLAEQPHIEDYDGIRTTLSTVFILPYFEAREIKFSAIFRTGYRDFNLSQRYEATFRLFDVPLYVYYFRGYGVEISTYQEKGSTYGIGFEFW